MISSDMRLPGTLNGECFCAKLAWIYIVSSVTLFMFLMVHKNIRIYIEIVKIIVSFENIYS